MFDGDALAVGEKSTFTAECSLCRRKPLPKQNFDVTYTQLKEATSKKCSRCSFIYTVVQCILSDEILRPDSQTRGVHVDGLYGTNRNFRFFLDYDTETQNIETHTWAMNRSKYWYDVFEAHESSAQLERVLGDFWKADDSWSKMHLLPGSTKSEATFATIKLWLDDCVQHHPGCDKGQSHLERPKRLLDLRNNDIVLVDNPGNSLTYACLSHCWGKTPMFKTTKAKLEEHKSHILLNELSQTFQDAVEICRRLGIFYLWIDSLCIIQDDADDWQLHAAQMADIYEHGLATIAATRSPDGSGGCFSKTEEPYMGKEIPGYRGIFVRKHARDFSMNNAAPLFSRAWTYQELKLSPRLVHFVDQEVMWQCKRGVRQKGGGGGFFDSFHEQNIWNSPRIFTFKDPVEGREHVAWNDIVSTYTSRDLTFPADKLAALAAVATRYGEHSITDEYFAGLWRTTFLHNMAWSVRHYKILLGGSRIEIQSQRNLEGRIPSWSWASVTGPVFYSYNGREIVDSVRIVDIQYLVKGPRMVGLIEEATVVLETPLLRVPLTLSPDRKRVFSLEEIDSQLRPEDESLQWDLEIDGKSTDLSPPLLIVPLLEQHVENFSHDAKWAYGSWSSFYGLVLQEIGDKNVYTRLGSCSFSWDYSEDSETEEARARCKAGRVAGKDMFEFLAQLPKGTISIV
ncbi:hypothetical protein PMIN07_006641 [Paraphaeosphaeria minitans]